MPASYAISRLTADHSFLGPALPVPCYLVPFVEIGRSPCGSGERGFESISRGAYIPPRGESRLAASSLLRKSLTFAMSKDIVIQAQAQNASFEPIYVEPLSLEPVQHFEPINRSL